MKYIFVIGEKEKHEIEVEERLLSHPILMKISAAKQTQFGKRMKMTLRKQVGAKT